MHFDYNDYHQRKTTCTFIYAVYPRRGEIAKGFYIQKARHFAKSKTICDTFLYIKSLTLCVTRFFIKFLKLAEGGCIFIFEKQCTLCYIFKRKKQCTLRYVLYLKFIVKYSYLTINVRAIRAIRSKNNFELFIENWSYSYDQ